MKEQSLILLKGGEISQLMDNEENELLKVVKAAYQAHAKGDSHMPLNSFLRFPGKEKERIIAKAAWIGGDFNAAGLKWIASFPGNTSKGHERASATLILNNPETGHPTAILESSIISAKRTAASAALAAQVMYPPKELFAVGIVGCGIINFETLRFLLEVYPMIQSVHLLDLSKERAALFKNKTLKLNSGLDVQFQDNFKSLLQKSPVIAFGTTAVEPFINSVEGHLPDAVLLHTSLRDLTTEVILSADNVVDDIEQICSNDTSVHLAEKAVNNRNFISASIGDILNGKAAPYRADQSLHIFNPFGLGVLDMAVAHWVEEKARKQQIGQIINNFLPEAWANS
jgi:2,3-diaminopropionate biosynthesis protein SbnB